MNPVLKYHRPLVLGASCHCPQCCGGDGDLGGATLYLEKVFLA